MNDMKWTPGKRALGVVIVTLTLAAAPVFFAVMFDSVNHLLAPSFGWLAWTVPVATELSFVIMYLLELLLGWLDRAPGWLRFAPYPFAAASLVLNVYAAHGNTPGIVGHAVVTVAFFTPLLALKAAVHRLTVSDDDRQREIAERDAIAHARDILRAADRWWRFRAPLMLRRQLRNHRLPAAVTTAIGQGVMFGGSAKWEPVVETWITKSLALPEGVAAQLAAARTAAVRSAVRAGVDTAEVPPVAIAANAGVGTAASPSVSTARTPAVNTAAKRKPVPAMTTDEDLAAILLPMFDGPDEVTKYAAVEAIKAARGKGVSYERVERIMELAQRMRVVPIDRKAKG